MRLWWVFIRILCEIQSAMLKHVFKPIHPSIVGVQPFQTPRL
jgi:hypothetical protein